MSVVVGIDPGMQGAIAVFAQGRPTVISDMPTYDGRVDGLELCAILDAASPDVAYLENTHPMPRNGSIASFKLGLNTGIVIGVVQALTIPLVRIPASTWKNWNGLRGKPKEASLHLARELWPHLAGDLRRARDEGRAEAALIARYGVYSQMHIGQTGADDNEDDAQVSELHVQRHPAARHTTVPKREEV
jgi:crossover junction endodeoxyribonuclease RuvC